MPRTLVNKGMPVPKATSITLATTTFTTANIDTLVVGNLAPLSTSGNVFAAGSWQFGAPTVFNLQLQLGTGVSVTGFGAACDGITDDSNAVKAGIDFVAARGGGVLLITNPTYLATPSLIPTNIANVTLKFVKPGKLVLPFASVSSVQFVGSTAVSNVVPTLSFAGGGASTSAAATVKMCMQYPDPSSFAGSGYSAAQVVTITGGTYTSQASIRVLRVSAGVIVEAIPQNLGSYTVLPANPVALSGGGTAIIVWQMQSVTVTNTGAGYTSAPTLALSSGSCQKMWAVGKTLTWKGGVDADPYAIFDGDVYLTGVRTTYPEWWGAVGGSVGGGNDTVAMQRCFDGTPSSATILLATSMYNLYEPVRLAGSQTVKGTDGLGRSTSGFWVNADRPVVWVSGSPTFETLTISTGSNAFALAATQTTAYFVDNAYGGREVTWNDTCAFNVWQGMCNQPFETFPTRYTSTGTIKISSKDHGMCLFYGMPSTIEGISCDNVNYPQNTGASHVYIYSYYKPALGGITLRKCGGLVAGSHGIRIDGMDGAHLLECWSDNAGKASVYVTNAQSTDVEGGFWYLSHNGWAAFNFTNCRSVLVTNTAVGANEIDPAPAVIDIASCTDVSVTNCTLARAIYGVRCRGCSKVSVSGTSMSGVVSGIYLDGSSSAVTSKSCTATIASINQKKNSALWSVPALGSGAAFSISCDYMYGARGKTSGFVAQFGHSENTGGAMDFGFPTVLANAGYRFGYNAYGGALVFTRDLSSQTTLLNAPLSLLINTWYNFSVAFDGASTWTYAVTNAASDSVRASGTVTDSAAFGTMTAASYGGTAKIIGHGGTIYTSQSIRNVLITSGGSTQTTGTVVSTTLFNEDVNSPAEIARTGVITLIKSDATFISGDPDSVRSLVMLSNTVMK
jgi:hypothetical protein